MPLKLVHLSFKSKGKRLIRINARLTGKSLNLCVEVFESDGCREFHLLPALQHCADQEGRRSGFCHSTLLQPSFPLSRQEYWSSPDHPKLRLRRRGLLGLQDRKHPCCPQSLGVRLWPRGRLMHHLHQAPSTPITGAWCKSLKRPTFSGFYRLEPWVRMKRRV